MTCVIGVVNQHRCTGACSLTFYLYFNNMKDPLCEIYGLSQFSSNCLRVNSSCPVEPFFKKLAEWVHHQKLAYSVR